MRNSVETRIMSAKSRLNRSFLERGKNRLIHDAILLTGPIVRMGEDNIIRSSSFSFADGFWNAYLEGREQGFNPINIGNHTVHFDAAEIAETGYRQLRAEKAHLEKEAVIKGFQLPLAMSVTNGDQGPTIHALYDIELPTLAKRHLTPLLLARSKDVTRYNARANLREYLKQVKEVVKDGFGLAALPEGTTTGGKRSHEETTSDGNKVWVPNENGQVNGMQLFEEGSIRSLVLATEKAGRAAMIIPVAIDGSYRIQKPETRRPTRWAFRLGLGLSHRDVVRVRIGLPMRSDQGELKTLIDNGDWLGVDKLIGTQIAAMLPPNQRGVYANQETLEAALAKREAQKTHTIFP